MTKTFTKVGDRAIVRILGSEEPIYVYIPSNGAPDKVAPVFAVASRAITGRYFPAGQVATDIIVGLFETRCRLVQQHEFEDFSKHSDVHYYLGWEGRRNRAELSSNIISSNQNFFVGTPEEFEEFAKNLGSFESIAKKVVQFKYRGGSNPGATRTVRVEDVYRKDGLTHIKGLDLEVDDLDEAYRHYTADKIEGDILILT